MDHAAGEARIAAREGSDFRTRRGHLPECGGKRGRRRDEIDGIAPTLGQKQTGEGKDNRVELGVGHEFEGGSRLNPRTETCASRQRRHCPIVPVNQALLSTRRACAKIPDMSLFDLDRLAEESGASLAKQYRFAEPFPHVVLENFLKVDADQVLSSFPDLEWDGWTDVASQSEAAAKHQPGKRRCRDIELIPPLLRQMIYELSAPRFLRAMSEITDIPNLLPDPFLEGGGIQCTTPGGKLVPHTDFHYPPVLKLFRRTNVLVFLNPDWKPGDGGELGLFTLGEDTPRITVPPRYGTCVLFTTDHRSVHGVEPVAETANPRRSIALYFYTVEEAEVFSGDRGTYWYEPFEPIANQGVQSKGRILVMKSALRASKALTRLAYRMNPQHPVA